MRNVIRTSFDFKVVTIVQKEDATMWKQCSRYLGVMFIRYSRLVLALAIAKRCDMKSKSYLAF